MHIRHSERSMANREDRNSPGRCGERGQDLPDLLCIAQLTYRFNYMRTWVDDLDSRFLVLTNAINHFCCLIQSNTAFDYKATFCKTECQN